MLTPSLSSTMGKSLWPAVGFAPRLIASLGAVHCSGQDEWTQYATLRSFKDITLPFISILFFSQERHDHAAVVINKQIILVGGDDSSMFNGELVKGMFAL